MAQLQWPLQFKRQNAEPLDVDSVFADLTALDAYIAGGTAYAGQVVSVAGVLYEIYDNNGTLARREKLEITAEERAKLVNVPDDTDAKLALKQDSDFLQDGQDYPNNDPDNYVQYGLLYTHDSAVANIPAGWRLPTEAELTYWAGQYQGMSSANYTANNELKTNGQEAGYNFEIADFLSFNTELWIVSNDYNKALRIRKPGLTAQGAIEDATGTTYYSMSARYVKDDDGSANTETTITINAIDYKIKKLSDGKIWFLDNYRLRLTENVTSVLLNNKTNISKKVETTKQNVNNLALNWDSLEQIHFSYNGNISSNSTVTFTNTTKALWGYMNLNIIGTVVLTFPSNVFAEDAETRFNNTAHTLTLEAAAGSGTRYEIVLALDNPFSGTPNWELKCSSGRDL